MTQFGEVLTTGEAAQFLRYSTRYLHQLRREGKGPAAVRLKNGKIRYTMRDLKVYLYGEVERAGGRNLDSSGHSTKVAYRWTVRVQRVNLVPPPHCDGGALKPLAYVYLLIDGERLAEGAAEVRIYRKAGSPAKALFATPSVMLWPDELKQPILDTALSAYEQIEAEAWTA